MVPCSELEMQEMRTHRKIEPTEDSIVQVPAESCGAASPGVHGSYHSKGQLSRNIDNYLIQSAKGKAKPEVNKFSLVLIVRIMKKSIENLQRINGLVLLSLLLLVLGGMFGRIQSKQKTEGTVASARKMKSAD